VLHAKHKKISIMFSQIPNEITQDVFDKLPIFDCKSIVDAHIGNTDHQRMQELYNERVSLDRYFTHNFGDGTKMMKLLAQTDSHLFGSRVIEYFNPGTIDEDSDWNFHASSSPRLRCHFMKSMEEFGVQWEDATSSFFRDIDTKDLSMVLKRSELDFIIEDSKRFELSEFHQMAIKCFIDASAHITPRRRIDKVLFFEGVVGRNSFICKDITPQIYSSDFANLLSIKGTLQFKGNQIRVYMDFTNYSEFTHHQMLHDTCFSIQQCLIGGFGALHMYGKLTASNVSYKWNRLEFLSEDSNQEKTDMLAHKYTLRGYEIRSRPYDKSSMINNRSYSDSDSVFVPYHNQLGCDEDSWKFMQTNSCHMDWVENRFDTYFKYTQYSSYFSPDTMEKCTQLRESLAIPLDEHYLMNYAAL
jgi:hypothetical protein